MAYDGKVRKSLNERAREKKIALDMPTINRKERRKDIADALRPKKDETLKTRISKKFCGSKKKYIAKCKEMKNMAVKTDG